MVSYLRLHTLFPGISLVALCLVCTSCGAEEGTSDASVFHYGGAVMGYSLEERPIIVERFGREGPVVFLFHAIHGNEVPAEQLGERMRTWLLLNPNAWEGLQVLFVTQVNADNFQFVLWKMLLYVENILHGDAGHALGASIQHRYLHIRLAWLWVDSNQAVRCLSLIHLLEHGSRTN